MPSEARPPTLPPPPFLLFASLSLSLSVALCLLLLRFFPFCLCFANFAFGFRSLYYKMVALVSKCRAPLSTFPFPLCLPLLAAIVGCVMRLSKFLAATAAPCLDSWLRLRRRLLASSAPPSHSLFTSLLLRLLGNVVFWPRSNIIIIIDLLILLALSLPLFVSLSLFSCCSRLCCNFNDMCHACPPVCMCVGVPCCGCQFVDLAPSCHCCHCCLMICRTFNVAGVGGGVCFSCFC